MRYILFWRGLAYFVFTHFSKYSSHKNKTKQVEKSHTHTHTHTKKKKERKGGKKRKQKHLVATGILVRYFSDGFWTCI